MTIEAQLTQINSNLEALLSCFKHIGGAVDIAAPRAPTQPPKQAEQLQKAEPKDAKPPVTPAPEAAGGVKYDDVKKAALNLSAKKGKAALTGVFAKFDITHGNQAKPEQYAEILTALNEAVAA